MIMLLALGFTMMGEGLAEVLNPRLLEKLKRWKARKRSSG